MNKLIPIIYRTKNWSSYSQTTTNRRNITIWFYSNIHWYAQSTRKSERNQIYSDATIKCYFMIKVLFRLTLRMTKGCVQSLINVCDLYWTAPD